MIEIRITNPSDTPREDLQKIVELLKSYITPATASGNAEKAAKSATAAAKSATFAATTGHVGAIANEDSPATGAPDIHDAKEAFSNPANEQSTLDPAIAFGPNAGGGVPYIADAATSMTAPAVAPTTATQPSGTLPVPNIAPLPHALPSAPVVPPVAAMPGNHAQVDKNGLPWDGRIHSETKSLNKGGTWRNKRGVEAAFMQQVEAELRHVQNLPIPASPMEAFGIPNVAIGAVITPTLARIAPVEAPVASYLSLVQKVTAARTAGKLTDEEVKAACLAVGIPNGAFPLLVTKPELVPSVDAQINAFIVARG